MGNAKANFERYLAGQPLTEELAALRRGESAGPAGLEALLEAFGPRPAPTGDDDKPLSREECLALKEAQAGGGVTTLMKLLRRNLHRRIEEAKMDSQNNPLGRAAEIAHVWAYVAIYRRICLEIEGMTAQAIASLDSDAAERGHE